MTISFSKRCAAIIAIAGVLATSCGDGSNDSDAAERFGVPASEPEQLTQVEIDELIANSTPARCTEQLLADVIDAADRQDPAAIAKIYGVESPVYQPALQIVTDTITDQFSNGARSAVDLATTSVAELCFEAEVANHVLGLREGDDGWMDAAAIDDLIGKSPTSVYDPSQAAAPAPPASENYVVVSARRYGSAQLGSDFTTATDATGLDSIATRNQPFVLDECGNGDIVVFWSDTGVNLRGANGFAFGYTARAEVQTNRGLAAGIPVDVAGSGLGWGASRDAIVDRFPDFIDYPDFTQIAVHDGVLQVGFGMNGLSVVSAGGNCSSGG